MADSMRDCLNQEDTISELKLLLANPISKGKTFVVVEGDGDVRLFKSLLSDMVTIVQSYQSKVGVEEIIQKHFPRKKEVIGIRDKDYQTKPMNKRIFYCDYCCVEMMIIADNDCFERICNMFCSGISSLASFRLKCLRCLEFLSKIRCLNEKKKWGINFKPLNLSSLYEPDQLKMNEKIVKKLNECNPSNTLTNKRISEIKKIFPKQLPMDDLLNLTNGHDFINILYKLGNITKESINFFGKAIHLSFTKVNFEKTLLYNNLLSYQEEKKLSIIIR